MATVQQNTEEQGFVARFAELSWLDSLISFAFKLIAKLAELFLGFGLVASAIDYGLHGSFLGGNMHLMGVWVTTQALALEGSAGSVLAMSFDADKEGDHVKATIQRVLAILLMIVGGIMFFAEMAESVPGFKAVVASGSYVYAMAALRSLVSLGYLAVCRTASHRYSGSEAPAQITTPALTDEDVAQQIEEQVSDVRNDLQAAIDELRNAVQGQIAEIPAQVHAAAQSMTYEVDPAALSAQINETVVQAVRNLNLRREFRGIAEEVVAQAVMRPAQRNTDELTSKTAQPKETAKIPTVSSALAEETEKRLRIQSYVAAQRAQGKEPTLDDIMAACDCAKNTASKWRKAMEVAQ